MAYDDEIAKLQLQPRAELYKIQVGTGETHYLTSFEIDVTFQSNEYLARPISRTEHEQESQFDTDSIQITVPITPFVVQYVQDGPTDDIIVTITEVFLTSGDFVQKFKGEVINITVQDDAGLLDVESSADSLRNEFPTQIYQATCQFETFDAGCGLVKALFEKTDNVTVVDTVTLEAPVLLLESSGYYTHGIATFGTVPRWITNHIGNQVTIQYPFKGIETGASVTFLPGDDKKRSTCDAKFGNVDRHTGFEKMPLKNMVVDGF